VKIHLTRPPIFYCTDLKIGLFLLLHHAKDVNHTFYFNTVLFKNQGKKAVMVG